MPEKIKSTYKVAKRDDCMPPMIPFLPVRAHAQLNLFTLATQKLKDFWKDEKRESGPNSNKNQVNI